MDTETKPSQYANQAKFLHLAIYRIAISSALAYGTTYFLLGSRPNALLLLLWVAMFLVAFLATGINIANTELDWNRRLLPVILFALGLVCAGQAGYMTRSWRFQQDLPRLNAIVSDIQAGRTPSRGTVTGAKGHRQLVVVVGGYYMTDFFAYIWQEDGKRPSSALRYLIDERDKVVSRGGGWYETLVSNGH